MLPDARLPGVGLTLSKALLEKGLVVLSVSVSPQGLEEGSHLDVILAQASEGNAVHQITRAPVSVQAKADSQPVDFWEGPSVAGCCASLSEGPPAHPHPSRLLVLSYGPIPCPLGLEDSS